MDFFEYANIVQSYVTLDTLWLSYLVGGLCFAVVFIFQAVALFVIAGREGYKHRWMAFVPFFNTYYIGVCGQKNRFFNIDTKLVGLVAAIYEAVLVGVSILYHTSFFTMLPFLEETTNELGMNVLYLPTRFADNNGDLAWAIWCINYLPDILTWANLLLTLMMIVLLNCFFQTYSARYYFLFTITSILFPIKGILFFAVKNNKGMSYAEYTRREQERLYQRYRNQQNYNPYNQNPYSNGYDRPQPPRQDAPNSSQSDPFGGEYGGSSSAPDDPFDEFKN